MARPLRDQFPTPLRLDGWTVHPRLNRLDGPDGEVSVEPRLMDVLLCLAASPGEVLTRDELLDRVWGDVVVGEEALTRAISELRRILGDRSQQPRFIETIRKGGYRLICPVEAVAATAPAAPSGSPYSPSPFSTGRARGLYVLAACVVLLVLWQLVARRQAEPADPAVMASQPLRTQPLTSYPGRETLPALSPDGLSVAFAWTGADEQGMDIYVKELPAETPLQLTHGPSYDVYPVWNPDGRSLSYLAVDDAGHHINTVPLLGGEPRTLLTCRGQCMGFTWVDEHTLIYADSDHHDGPGRIYRRNLRSGDEHRLIDTPEGLSDAAPLLSPDGATLAFLRFEPGGRTDIHLHDLAAGRTRRLTTGLENVDGVCWVGDGRSLVLASRINGNYTLWRAWLPDGRLTWVPVHGEWMFYPTVARDAHVLAYQHRWFEKNVWRITVGDDVSGGLSTEPVITSSRWDCEAYYSADGNHLAFTSSRSGNLEIWACQADGGHPVQLTQFEGPSLGTPAWSPEGARVALAASPGGFSHLYVVGYADRVVRQVTEGRHHDRSPTWSADGRWLYCGSNRDGQWQIWKVPARSDSTLAPVRITDQGGIRAREAADGRAVYFARRNQAGLWRLDLDADGLPTGEPQPVLSDLPRRGHWDNWDLWDGGLVLLDYDDEGPFLLRHHFATGETEVISHVPNVASPSVTISRDGRHLLYARIESSVVDLVLVEGFE